MEESRKIPMLDPLFLREWSNHLLKIEKSVEEGKKQAHEMNNNKSPEPDGIYPRVIKNEWRQL